MLVMTLNCGSSSAKFSIMETDTRKWLVKGIVERVTIGGSFIKVERDGKKVQVNHDCPDHTEAIKLIVDTLTKGENKIMDDLSAMKAVGHRVVHGGEKFASSALITEDLLKVVEECSSLAPLHNPPNIMGIRAAMKVLRTSPTWLSLTQRSTRPCPISPTRIPPEGLVREVRGPQVRLPRHLPPLREQEGRDNAEETDRRDQDHHHAYR